MNPDDHTLADELHACVMDLARVHHITEQLLDVLGAFGSPHVELEPSNVIIGTDDVVALRHGSRAARRPWAAPETLHDGTLTYRSNVYSVGAMLQAMFADRPGFSEQDRNLVGHCMASNPMGRPSFEALRSSFRPRSRRSGGEWYRRVEPKDDRERTFIDSLRKDPEDSAMRGVYADWLEERGDTERAAFLRRQDPEDRTAKPELASWRAIVSRATIIGCSRTDCAAGWHGLQPIDNIDNIRDCTRCRQTVTYCTSLERAEDSGRMRAPIALDARLVYMHAVSAHDRGRMPIVRPTYNPPPPPPPPVGNTLPLPGNPPRPNYSGEDVPNERNALARFFGWLRRR